MSESSQKRKFAIPVRTGRRKMVKQQSSRFVGVEKKGVFERSYSDLSVNRLRDGDSSNTRRPSPLRGLLKEASEPIVQWHKIHSEVFARSPSMSPSSSSSSLNQEAAKAEPKVVINVAVEGSPGPIRTMVKLCCNVEEAIKIVSDKYCEEGRTPKLDQGSAYKLHHSHFSIQSLEKRKTIGEIGSRSFYMRKKVNEAEASSSALSPLRSSFIASSNLIETFIAQIIGKFMRRTKRVWNILVCSQ